MRSNLHFFEAKGHVTLQNIWRLIKEVFQQIGQDNGCSIILLEGLVHLLLKLDILRLQELILVLSVLQFLFDLADLVFQECNNAVILTVGILLRVGEVLVHVWGSRLPSVHHAATETHDSWLAANSLFIFHILYLLFQSLNNFLAEMTSFRKLFLYFLMNLDISLECIDLSLHLVVFVKELLSLSGLVL